MGYGTYKYLKIFSHLRYILDCILEVIYCGDNKCLICGEIIFDESYLCKSCMKKIKLCSDIFKIKKSETSFECISAAYYSKIIAELVLRLKYKSDFRCGEALALIMSRQLEKRNMKFDIITFVPCSEKALKKRGYNQSEFLARKIGRYFDVPVKRLLNKTLETKDQIGLDAEMRWKNLYGSFAVTRDNLIAYKNILLVDDVITTGATTFYCGMQLIKSGANSVKVLTAAKSKI